MKKTTALIELITRPTYNVYSFEGLVNYLEFNNSNAMKYTFLRHQFHEQYINNTEQPYPLT